ncbi:MAG: cyclase family protein [Anaerolineae bacterium]
MSSKIIDITHPLQAGIATWPGDTPFKLERMLNMSDGESVNLTTITMSAHTGTHVDAPLHFQKDGTPLEQVDLSPFWGLAQVISVKNKPGGLLPADIAHVDLSLAPRLLIHSAASHEPTTQFIEQFVYPTPEIAAYLRQNNIVLYGTDAPSMDDMHDEALPGHNALQTNGISILEGLNLADVEDGVYELSALPLKLVGGDGSPVRAVLKTT